MKSFIILRSSTMAWNAVNALKKAKITAGYDKISSPHGCRFGVWVNGDPEHICRILQLGGIECLDIKREGELT